eukprot:scaffold96070_cov19-Tisochrysis_lutea.AAC.3
MVWACRKSADQRINDCMALGGPQQPRTAYLGISGLMLESIPGKAHRGSCAHATEQMNKIQVPGHRAKGARDCMGRPSQSLGKQQPKCARGGFLRT